MRHRPSSALRAAAVLSLALAAACSDQLTTPDSPVAAAPRPSADVAPVSSGQPTLHPNRTRYRDHGHRPATGMSGSAMLTMQALLGRDGATEVMLSTARASVPWWTLGTITNVQTRASSPDGKHMFTRAHNLDAGGGTASVVYRGLSRGAALQVQAAVKDIDPNRTDVVAVDGTVLRRPNLAVAEVGVPARVRSGAWTHIAGVIRETNGDVGNWAFCQLYVDGQLVDWAEWVWVDAGDVVSCAFLHRFQGDGPHRVEVRAGPEPNTPRDDDPDDNSAAVTVEGFSSNELFYTAVASQTLTYDSAVSVFRWRSGTVESETHDRWLLDSSREYTVLNATLPRAISPGSLRLELTETTGGATIASSTHELATWPVSDDGSFCGVGWNGGTGGYVSLCSYTSGGGSTWFSYFRYAGSVAYHSYHYSRTWDRLTGEEYVYSYNYSDGSTRTTLHPFGGDFAMRARLYTGDEVFTADPAFPLSVSEIRGETPYSCQSWVDPFWDYSTEQCLASSHLYRTASGDAFG